MDPHSFISRKSIESIDFNTWQVLPSQIVKGGIEGIDFKTFSKKCAKSYFEQLSHSMSVSKINGYARIQGKTSFLATAKLAIFATDILWESCSK